MSATHARQSNTTGAPKFYLALELSWNSWKLAFTVGLGQKARLRTVPARNSDVLLAEIQKAKARFGLPADAPVVACYEAGRDTFPFARNRAGRSCHFRESPPREFAERGGFSNRHFLCFSPAPVSIEK